MGSSRQETHKAGIYIYRNDRVKKQDGAIVPAGENEAAIGFAQNNAAKEGAVAVLLVYPGGSFRAIAEDAFTKGVGLYGAVDGRVQAAKPTKSPTIMFEALTESNGTGSVVEVRVLSQDEAKKKAAEAQKAEKA